MRFSALPVAAVAAATLTLTATPVFAADNTPSDAMKPFTAILGSFSCSGMHNHPGEEPEVMTTTVRNELEFKGSWLTSHISYQSGEHTGTYKQVWGFDATRKQYVQHAFYAGGGYGFLSGAAWDGTTLELTTADDAAFAHRSVLTVTGDNTYTIRFDDQTDGEWVMHSEQSCTRQDS